MRRQWQRLRVPAAPPQGRAKALAGVPAGLAAGGKGRYVAYAPSAHVGIVHYITLTGIVHYITLTAWGWLPSTGATWGSGGDGAGPGPGGWLACSRVGDGARGWPTCGGLGDGARGWPTCGGMGDGAGPGGWLACSRVGDGARGWPACGGMGDGACTRSWAVVCANLQMAPPRPSAGSPPVPESTHLAGKKMDP